MFDIDQDGILNLVEAQHTLCCVGFRATAQQVWEEIKTNYGCEEFGCL